MLLKYDNELTLGAKMLYETLVRLSSIKGYAWPTNAYLADEFGRCTRTITAWIGDLFKAGYISIKNIYYENSKKLRERRIFINKNAPIPATKTERIKKTKKNNKNNAKNEKNTQKNEPENTENIPVWNATSIPSIEENCQENINSHLYSLFVSITENFKGLNNYVKNKITEYSDIFGKAYIELAVDEACQNGGQHVNYILKILKTWVDAELTTVAQVKEYNDKFKAEQATKREETKQGTSIEKNSATRKPRNNNKNSNRKNGRPYCAPNSNFDQREYTKEDFKRLEDVLLGRSTKKDTKKEVKKTKNPDYTIDENGERKYTPEYFKKLEKILTN